MNMHRLLRRCALLAGLTAGLLSATTSWAVPSFARQTGQDCAACHIGAFGPQLTPFGIKFKIGGYTDSNGSSGNVPLSGMVVASRTHTGKAQDAAPVDGYKTNDNAALDEASLFIAGKLADQLGAFMQVTYDGIGKKTAIDQMDLRFAHATEWQGKELILGASLNNNPGVQDPFNSMPVWGFPYIGSALGFSGPETGTLINGALEQHVLGASAYAFLDNSWYAELGSYRSLSLTAQSRLGLGREDDPGKLGNGTAYWRLAWFKDLKSSAYSVGLFGFNSSIQPDRTNGSGSNRYRDIGIDGQYQFLGTREHVFTLQGSYVHETQRRDALLAAGEASNLNGSLNELKLNASYHFNQSWGLSLGHFRTDGTADSLLYAANAGNVPDSAGQILQLDWTPFGKEDSWGAPWANVKLGAQYTRYSKYNGAAKNYDGAGRNAADNNTLFLFAWTSF
ncbi:cytochrome c1 protein [Paucibacter sp. B2R-40]|uniref:cytochrome c1 protein n=1 Tax=Paucibacter sp. B2R-40 TaxID=2893554 RepID=UPI0021E41051|nr:cytochrome c1 protein [Paucibacter sp. B2R-40]MCV2353460.1 cytochrome c1 protein [Paucibacter sp. B2R-40]